MHFLHEVHKMNV